jgi:hypothetical protein
VGGGMGIFLGEHNLEALKGDIPKYPSRIKFDYPFID